MKQLEGKEATGWMTWFSGKDHQINQARIPISGLMGVVDAMSATPQEQWKNAGVLKELKNKFNEVVKLIDTKLFLNNDDVIALMFLSRFIKVEHLDKLKSQKLNDSIVFSVMNSWE